MSEPVIVCEVIGSRTKASVPERLLVDRDEQQLDAFFRDLLRLPKSARVIIRRAA